MAVCAHDLAFCDLLIQRCRLSAPSDHVGDLEWLVAQVVELEHTRICESAVRTRGLAQDRIDVLARFADSPCQQGVVPCSLFSPISLVIGPEALSAPPLT